MLHPACELFLNSGREGVGHEEASSAACRFQCSHDSREPWTQLRVPDQPAGRLQVCTWDRAIGWVFDFMLSVLSWMPFIFVLHSLTCPGCGFRRYANGFPFTYTPKGSFLMRAWLFLTPPFASLHPPLPRPTFHPPSAPPHPTAHSAESHCRRPGKGFPGCFFMFFPAADARGSESKASIARRAWRHRRAFKLHLYIFESPLPETRAFKRHSWSLQRAVRVAATEFHMYSRYAWESSSSHPSSEKCKTKPKNRKVGADFARLILGDCSRGRTFFGFGVCF